ncbi:ganglioside GM2 activator-like [Uloborus diversus]|uniref:ganglioside GM2 activator-like n=1 Tax=Uloborus diversus TaxID=327109 RepID=UPI00240A3D18|nr:ganglioside GM2 activator-like [Uloborus diversus]
MKTFVSFAAVFLVAGFVNCAEKQFKFEDCSQGKGIADIHQFVIAPDPISFSQNVTAWVDIDLNEDIPAGTQVKMKVYKVTNLFGFPVKLPAPCFAGIGSCNYEHCNFLKKFEVQGRPFYKEGAEYGCPITVGHYGAQNATVPMPELGGLIKFIASGEFRVEVKVVHKSRMLACAIFTGKARP